MEAHPEEKLPLLDFHPKAEDFLGEVLEGLRGPRKTLPCKFFYDVRGSRLFDRICELDEYYITRTELRIMERHAGEMAEAIGPRAAIVELGSGSGVKTRLLLESLESPVAYIPVEISRGHLLHTSAELARAFPDLEVLCVCADFTGTFTLPRPRRRPEGRAVYFPGSTIGNFTRAEARALLERMARVLGPGSGLLIGVDLKKDPGTLEAAYNDREGVTRAFNLNLLVRINAELDADFRLDRFRHQAVYNAADGRVEMHLESLADQTVRVGGEAFRFKAGETIHTESSHKYTPEEFARLAAGGGWRVEKVWTDPARMFSVQYLTARGEEGGEAFFGEGGGPPAPNGRPGRLSRP